MNRSEYLELLEEALSGKLSSEQKKRFESLLSAHPTLRKEWEDELLLNTVLSRLPDVPISTNFTSRVLQAAQRLTKRSRPGFLFWPRFSWVHGAATAIIVVSLGLAGLKYQNYSARRQMANELGRMNEVASILPATAPSDIEVLKNFDAIRTLAYVPAQSDVDLELLTALEK
jgi:hypothetical protein